MSDPNVLLITGSRSLSKTALPLRAFDTLMRPLFRGADLVVAGDATGPDSWAICGAVYSYEVEQWQLNGIVSSRFSAFVWSESRRNDPLVRNRCMVESVRDRFLRRDKNVLCVGFVDPESRTHGTDHTLRLARQAGIWTARYVWQGERFEEQS